MCTNIIIIFPQVVTNFVDMHIWNSQLKPHSLQSELIDVINHNGRYVPNLENADKNTWISTRVCKSKMRIKINQDANFSDTILKRLLSRQQQVASKKKTVQDRNDRKLSKK